VCINDNNSNINENDINDNNNNEIIMCINNINNVWK